MDAAGAELQFQSANPQCPDPRERCAEGGESRQKVERVDRRAGEGREGERYHRGQSDREPQLDYWREPCVSRGRVACVTKMG